MKRIKKAGTQLCLHELQDGKCTCKKKGACTFKHTTSITDITAELLTAVMDKFPNVEVLRRILLTFRERACAELRNAMTRTAHVDPSTDALVNDLKGQLAQLRKTQQVANEKAVNDDATIKLKEQLAQLRKTQQVANEKAVNDDATIKDLKEQLAQLRKTQQVANEKAVNDDATIKDLKEQLAQLRKTQQVANEKAVNDDAAIKDLKEQLANAHRKSDNFDMKRKQLMCELNDYKTTSVATRDALSAELNECRDKSTVLQIKIETQAAELARLLEASIVSTTLQEESEVRVRQMKQTLSEQATLLQQVLAHNETQSSLSSMATVARDLSTFGINARMLDCAGAATRTFTKNTLLSKELLAAFLAGASHFEHHRHIKTLDEASTLCLMAFHGSNSQNITSILTNGFDPQRRRGQALGPGEYFTSTHATALGYSRGTDCVVVVLILSQSISVNRDGVYVVNNPADRRMTFCLPVGVWSSPASVPAQLQDVNNHNNKY